MKKVILTSSLGGAKKVEYGRRVPDYLLPDNGLVDFLKSIWTEQAKVLIISASPDDDDRNDGIRYCLGHAFPMSGLSVGEFLSCDRRSMDLIERLSEMNVIILSGGHVPTQNAFFKELHLRERLEEYNGIVIGLSAGSMNSAEMVYAGPELPGEAIDPNFERWIPGLGLTKTNIFPHYQDLKDETLDGLRIMEDITFSDSMGHEIIVMIDGSYIVIDESGETLFGEAYRVKDGVMTKICEVGGSVRLDA